MLKLISSSDLKSLLQKEGYELVVALHHVLYEKGLDSDFSGIRCIKYDELSHVKSQSRILITDFSSMSFDFLFKKMPVLFFDLDSNDESRFVPRDREALNNIKSNLTGCGNYCKDVYDLTRVLDLYIHGGIVEREYSSSFFVSCNEKVNQKLMKEIKLIW